MRENQASGDGGIKIVDLHLTSPSGEAVFESAALHLPDGTVAGISGKHGSGKSVLINLLMGDATPHQGDIRLWSESVIGRSHEDLLKIREEVGYVPRDDGLINNLRVLENLVFPALYHRRRDEAEAIEEIESYLKMTELEETAAQFPGGLPQTTRRILAVIRSLVARPKFMLADDLPYGLTHKELAKVAVLLQGTSKTLPGTSWVITSLNRHSLEELGLKKLFTIQEKRIMEH